MKVVVIVEKPLIQVTETNQICNHKCDCQKRKREKKKKNSYKWSNSTICDHKIKKKKKQKIKRRLSNMDPRFQTQVIDMIISVTTIWKNKKRSYKQLKPMCDLNYNCCMTWVLQFLKQLCNLAKQLLLQENVIFLTQKGTFHCVDIFKPSKKL